MFEVLGRGNFIIDPYINRCDWDWRVVKTILTRKVKEYEKSPKFDEYYDDICDLINEADYIFGHSLDGDAKALNDECLRYNLKSIDFEFYDIKEFYKEYTNTKKDISVQNIKKAFNIEGEETEHDAEADAYNTMLGLKAMLEQSKLSLNELITLCPKAKNNNKNYEVESIVINQKIREEKFKEALSNEGDNTMKRGRAKSRLFLQFLDNVLPTKECEKKLSGLKFSISINYEEMHYRQMLNIVQILCNLGATYVMKASLADVFVTYEVLNEDGTLKDCSKLKHVQKANEEGANIKIITFNEFMDMLEITEDELDNMPMVCFDCLYREDAILRDKKTIKIIKNSTNKPKEEEPKADSVILGDLYGNVLEKFINKKENK